MPGRVYIQLLELGQTQYGFVTSDDARALGVNPLRLQDLARRGDAERIGHGVYRLLAVPAQPLDGYMEATLWPHGARGVLSHETALDLYELGDVNPARIHITVPKRFRPRRATPKRYVLHHRDLAPTEQTVYEGIPIVTPVRAILDAIDAHLGVRLIEQAADSAVRRGLLNPDEAETVRTRMAEIAAA